MMTEDEKAVWRSVFAAQIVSDVNRNAHGPWDTYKDIYIGEAATLADNVVNALRQTQASADAH